MGSGRQKIAIVTEYPTFEEDHAGTALAGRNLEYLDDLVHELGFDLLKDCRIAPAIRCMPEDPNRNLDKSIIACKPKFDAFIRSEKPRMVWLLGGAGVRSLMFPAHRDQPARFKNKSLTRWRGLTFPDYSINSYVCATYGIPWLLSKNQSPAARNIALRDLESSLVQLESTGGLPPYDDPKKEVVHLLHVDDILTVLNEVRQQQAVFVHDYESSGLQPLRQGSLIWCVGCTGADGKSYVFPLGYYGHFTNEEQYKIEDALVGVLEDTEVPKVAHNGKFEDAWARHVLGARIRGWEWCTMVTQHILDERDQVTSLKFQAFIRYGVEGYEHEIKPYMEKVIDGRNCLWQVPLWKLMDYCGIDVVNTRKLYEDQRREVQAQGLWQAADLYHDGWKAMGDIQSNGIILDTDYYDKEKARITALLDELSSDIQSSKEAVQFRKIAGERLDVKKDDHVRVVLFDILGADKKKVTESGLDSVDKSVLGDIDTEFTRNLLQFRKWLKVRDTYMAQFLREVVTKKNVSRIHPSFDIHIARTGRSSSSNPNFQNIPARDDDAKRSCRSGIRGRRGHRFGENDYGSVEVRVAACCTKDPVLIAYILDESTDMHRDTAVEVFLLDDTCVGKYLKKLRQEAKNRMVFPEFYGSWFRSIAKSIWVEVVMREFYVREGVTVREHLAQKGIRTYDEFENHIKHVENRFWERFHVFKAWQEKLLADYAQFGYVETLFGYRRRGYLSNNEVINTPIQGTAFQCLLWSSIRLNAISKKEKWSTRFVGQIHDSIAGDFDPLELQYVLDTMERVMTVEVREANDKLIVPLVVEPDIGPINGSWFEKEGWSKTSDGLWVPSAALKDVPIVTIPVEAQRALPGGFDVTGGKHFYTMALVESHRNGAPVFDADATVRANSLEDARWKYGLARGVLGTDEWDSHSVTYRGLPIGCVNTNDPTVEVYQW